MTMTTLDPERLHYLRRFVADLWERPVLDEQGLPIVKLWPGGLIAFRDRFGMITGRDPNLWTVVRRRDLTEVTGEVVGYTDAALRVKAYDLGRQPPTRVQRLTLDDVGL